MKTIKMLKDLPVSPTGLTVTLFKKGKDYIVKDNVANAIVDQLGAAEYVVDEEKSVTPVKENKMVNPVKEDKSTLDALKKKKEETEKEEKKEKKAEKGKKEGK